jgi:NADPH-ferrihemoprotein reductase
MNAAAMPLAGTNFAVFGLGNTQYEHFNASGKVLDALLEKSGGERLMKIALGNDDDDIAEDFSKWTDQVGRGWPVCKLCPCE